MNTIRVVTSSRFLLFAAWLVALTSIPSAGEYQAALDKQTPVSQIHTTYDSSTFVLNIALLASWISTARWMATKAGAPAGAVWWGWIVPGASLFVPRRFIGKLTGHHIQSGELNVWWGCWLGFSVLANFGLAQSLTSSTPVNPIKPVYELAGVCLLTASYFIWQHIVVVIDELPNVSSDSTTNAPPKKSKQDNA